ncbi:MAG TPA: DUF3667 domain-containing protein [Flavisolibacter sp.]|nr:DUF3667 domain-containing protein [Flavisolibacter sp.]
MKTDLTAGSRTVGEGAHGEHQPGNCLNCGIPLLPASRYCSHCGQSAEVHRLSLAHLGHDLLHFLTHADKGIFHLVKALAVHPGMVIREYISGRRKKYFNPLNFFFIVVGLFLFAQTTFKPMSGVSLDAAREEVRKITDATVRERRLIKLDRVEKAMNFTARYSNYINMAVTPLVALIFFLWFRRMGYNYTEHLVANLYIAGFNALVFVAVITPYLVLTKGTGYHLWGVFGFLVWELFYRAFAYYRFLPKKGWLFCLSVIGAALFSVVAWYLLSRGLISWYIEKGF